jgi:3-methyladenine DNA glycosylase AlkD
LAQLHAKARTDTKLLADALGPSLGDREFFLAKAIGWALREYAKTDEAWVRRYLEAHRDGMAKLSVREAEKHLV